MAALTDYEQQRLENIKRNKALINSLGIQRQQLDSAKRKAATAHPSKRRRVTVAVQQPTRVSARLAATDTKPSYRESDIQIPLSSLRERRSSNSTSPKRALVHSISAPPRDDINEIRAGWTAWDPVASPPIRDDNGTFHFDSHEDFLPNKSPEEMLREGCFGGSYFRPLHSAHLRTDIEDDWKELPEEWIAGLNVKKYLTNPVYDPEINKYKVSCGQSIEEWEANGWIAHEFDVRGWFQWYCRFFQGRRCADDDRQVSRWKKCVGETGRWRRILLKKYYSNGINTVWNDDGDDEIEVSPVIHQTCHHWAWEVRQDVLDRFWKAGGR